MDRKKLNSLKRKSQNQDGWYNANNEEEQKRRTAAILVTKTRKQLTSSWPTLGTAEPEIKLQALKPANISLTGSHSEAANISASGSHF